MKVAQNLEYEQIHLWEEADSGQGKLASGRFSLFMKFHPRLIEHATKASEKPLEMLERYWYWEERGWVTTPELEVRRMKFGKTRLAQNLRFINI